MVVIRTRGVLSEKDVAFNQTAQRNALVLTSHRPILLFVSIKTYKLLQEEGSFRLKSSALKQYVNRKENHKTRDIRAHC